MRIQISAFGAFHHNSRISQRSVYYHRIQYYCTQSGRKKKCKRTTIIRTQQSVWCVSFSLCVFSLFVLFSLSLLCVQLFCGTLISLPTNKWYKKKRREKRQPKQLVYFTIIINSTFFSFFARIRFEIALKFFFMLLLLFHDCLLCVEFFRYIS